MKRWRIESSDNAGTMAGRVEVFTDFCLNIYLACKAYSDQAAANILISLSGYKVLTKLSAAESGWACQAGATADPEMIDQYRPFLRSPNQFSMAAPFGPVAELHFAWSISMIGYQSGHGNCARFTPHLKNELEWNGLSCWLRSNHDRCRPSLAADRLRSFI